MNYNLPDKHARDLGYTKRDGSKKTETCFTNEEALKWNFGPPPQKKITFLKCDQYLQLSGDEDAVGMGRTSTTKHNHDTRTFHDALPHTHARSL